MRLFVRYPALLSAALAVTAATADPAAEFKAKFESRLRDAAADVDGVVGYSVLDLTSGDRFVHLENDVFPTASTIKLAIVYELFRDADDKKIALDDTLALDPRKKVGGTGVLTHLGTPTLSIRDYAALMVTLSDNTATNVLIDRLGMDAITSRMRSLGLINTRLRRHMMDTEAARRGDENVSTPEELVKLLRNMYEHLEPAVTLLKLPKESRLRRGLPSGVQTADKPGELDGVRVDAGIVFAKNRPYIFAAMATYLKSEAEGERAIENMSRAAYEYFERLGTGGAFGRRIG